LTPPTDPDLAPANAKVVEGSDGLLLEIDGQIVPNYDATIHPFQEGDVVTGHVVRIDNDEVLVDIGYKSEGVIPSGELSIRKSVDPADEVTLGEEVDALVLTKEDQDGRLILSKKRARFEKAWRRIEAAAESGEPVEGSVIEVVKGGLIIDLGVRGFLPASLVDIRRVPNLDEYMGQTIECKVIELNRSRNNVVLSRRAVLEEQRKEDRERILDRLQPGQIVEGTISNIVDFGAFVDLDGIDGLIHISELSWSHVNHPSEILSIGDTVSVKVLDIDRQRQRISLGLKQTQEDPWQRVVDTYNIGDELEGNVTKVVTFGAFVEILDGVEGLVHISELAQHHVDNPREIIQPGDPVRVKILEIDSERRRLSLSIKRVEGQVLPVRPIEPPTSGDSYDDVPELGLSEDVFAGEDSMASAETTVLDPTEIADAEVTADPDADVPEAVAPEAEAEAVAPEAEAEAVAPEIEAEAVAPEPEAEAEAVAPEAEVEAVAPEAEEAEPEAVAPEAEAEAVAPEAEAAAEEPAPEADDDAADS
jgi:small subunit ribosomal protein S1